MDTKFKVGDRVQRKDGKPFDNGHFEVVLCDIDNFSGFYRNIGNGWFYGIPLELLETVPAEIFDNIIALLDRSSEPAHTALRYNTGKPRLSMIPSSAKIAMAEVLMYGADKYEKDNWRKGTPFTECLDSLERHLEAFKEGEDVDEESGKPHLAHIMVNAAFIHEWMKTGVGTDDRWKGKK